MSTFSDYSAIIIKINDDSFVYYQRAVCRQTKTHAVRLHTRSETLLSMKGVETQEP